MMVMVSNQSRLEFGYLAGRYPGSIGHLYSPGGQRGPYHFIPYALDNGAFTATAEAPWTEGNWRSLLNWAALSGLRPLWALVPDVVGNRRLTLLRWEEYIDVVREYRFRPAFAVQDGMSFRDVPDADCALFLGGSDDWKDAAIEPWCQHFPGRVHVGRVNTWDRLVRSWRAGAVSVDGTGWWHKALARPGQSQMAELFKFIAETHQGGQST